MSPVGAAPRTWAALRGLPWCSSRDWNRCPRGRLGPQAWLHPLCRSASPEAGLSLFFRFERQRERGRGPLLPHFPALRSQELPVGLPWGCGAVSGSWVGSDVAGTGVGERVSGARHAAARRPRFCRSFLPRRRPGCPRLTGRQSRGAARTRAALRVRSAGAASGPGVCRPCAPVWPWLSLPVRCFPLSAHARGGLLCLGHLNALLRGEGGGSSLRCFPPQRQAEARSGGQAGCVRHEPT